MTLPPSDHFNGKTFFNPGSSSARGWRDLLRWKLTSRPVPWPRGQTAEIKVAEGDLNFRGLTPSTPVGEGIAVSWIGHASFLLRTARASFLTDPVFSERIGPFPGLGLGPRRAMAPGLDFDQLPRIEAVLLSHDHYDHCDRPTLRRLGRRDAPTVASPLGHAGLLASAECPSVVELDWWEERTLPGGAAATLVPARHWCRRRPGDTNVRLWGGFVLNTAGRRVYFAGDSGYDGALFAEIGRRCGPFDLALIPIGAYEPRWFMRDAHMNPAEAVQAHRAVRARRSIGMHWGTFQLTDEGREEPVRALEEAVREAGLGAGEFTVLAPGGSISV